jgi:hypothetical protein
MILNKEKPDFTDRKNVIPDKEEDVCAEKNIVILNKWELTFAENGSDI